MIANRTLGDALGEALRTAEPGVVEVEQHGRRVIAEVAGAGPYGADLKRLRVEGEFDVPAAVDAIEQAVTRLPERLERFEVEPTRGVLRTAREQVRDREYYEVEVTPDGIDFARYRYRGPGERELVTENYGRRELKQLVDDLAG